MQDFQGGLIPAFANLLRDKGLALALAVTARWTVDHRSLSSMMRKALPICDKHLAFPYSATNPLSQHAFMISCVATLGLIRPSAIISAKSQATANSISLRPPFGWRSRRFMFH